MLSDQITVLFINVFLYVLFPTLVTVTLLLLFDKHFCSIGAKVMVKCRNIKSDKTTYSCEGVTDHSGTYKIPISGDHENEICETVLVSSPQTGCTTVAPGRDRARLALTHNNGIASDNRYANNLGFVKDAPLAGCAELLKQYQEFDD